MKTKKIDSLTEKVSKENLYKYYIIENHNYEETFTHFQITRKDLRRLLTEYEIIKDYRLRAKNNKFKRSHEESVRIGKKSAETQKKSWLNKSAEKKEEWRQLCKDVQLGLPCEIKQNKVQKAQQTYNDKSQKEKDKINKRRSVSCKKTWSNPNIIAKQHQTKRNNRKSRICRSELEQTVYDSLIERFPDLVYDSIIDERYNFYVDFYIPSQDLFIEINGHPSHGNYPYIDGDKQSMEESYKLYGDWLKVYTKLDVKKNDEATKNKINYLRIYPYNSLENNYKINNNKFKDIIKIIINSITK